MDWVNFSTEICLDKIKVYKKSIKFQVCLILFMLGVVIFDWFNMIHSYNMLMPLGMGMIVINIVWGLLTIVECYCDLGLERHRLIALRELHDKRLSEDEMQQYEIAKKQCDELRSELMERLKAAGVEKCEAEKIVI